MRMGLSTDNTDFSYLRSAVQGYAGLTLDPRLFQAGIQSGFPQWGIAGVEVLARKIRGGDQELLHQLSESVAVNLTWFFREPETFDHLRTVALPRILAAKRPDEPLRLWSAAASDGQEAYSMAMLLREAADQIGKRKVEILGTDLCKKMITQAREGVYAGDYRDACPDRHDYREILKKNVRESTWWHQWQVDEPVRAMTEFRTMNLTHDFGAMKPFDIVFCRNVLPYFNAETKKGVLSSIRQVMPSHGVLYVGMNDDDLLPSSPFWQGDRATGLDCVYHPR